MTGTVPQGRSALHRGGRLLRFVVGIALGLTIATAAGIALLAWRLSQGPLELPWLAREIAAQATAEAEGRTVTVGSATLAWEGLGAVDRPLDIRLSDVRVRARDGTTEIALPEAAVSLSLRRLVLGEIAPRSILLRRPRLSLVRAEDGSVSVAFVGEAEGAPGDAGVAHDLLEDLTHPERDGSRFGRFARLRIEQARLEIIDHALGTIWHVPDATIDVVRRPEGGLSLAADLHVTLGENSMRAAITGGWTGAGLELDVDATPVRPAVLAQTIPALAPLAGLDAPVATRLTLRLDPQFRPRGADLSLTIGAGTATLPEATVAFERGALRGGWDGTAATVQEMTLRLADAGGHAGPTIRLSGEGQQRQDGTYGADLRVQVDAVPLAALPALWPQGVAANPRVWMVENLTDGTARDLTLTAQLTVPADRDLDRIDLVSLSGQGRAEQVTVHWLQPVPPLTGVDGEITFTKSEVTIHSRGGGTGPIRAGDARILVTGLDAADQFLRVEAPLSGPVPAVLDLLRHPRLKLFEKRPLDLRNPGGQVAAQLIVVLPMIKDLDLDTLQIEAAGKLSDVRLGAIVLGRDLDSGAFDFSVDPDGLKLSGTARVGGIQARLSVEEDFRSGPPTQVVSRQSVSTKTDAHNFAGFGFDPAPYLTGPVALDVQAQARRNGQLSVALKADLGEARLAIDDLAWQKPAGRPARAEATVALAGERITGIDPIRLDGDGISVRGRATATREGGLERIVFDQVQLGDNRLSGEVALASGNRPLAATIRGQQLDLSARFGRRRPAEAQPPEPETPGPPYEVDIRLDRVQFGPQRLLHGVAMTLRSDGRLISQARATGRTAAQGGAFELTLAPQDGRRTLRVTAADAGALLRTFDILDRMQGGTLTVSAAYDDSKPGRPLSGTAEIAEFAIRDAPGIAKLMQAMTLYGLVEALRTDGLHFAQLVAPFSLTEDALALGESRAFSASLGLTATGRIDLARQRTDITGTIVPAYFFNSLLGHIPLIGRLFSPEQGSGLFAARYTVRGPLDDPEVAINPLSALTPGFLRGLFGILDGGNNNAAPARNGVPPPAAATATPPAAPAPAGRPAPTMPQTQPDGGGG